jgi:hypothetical protein
MMIIILIGLLMWIIIVSIFGWNKSEKFVIKLTLDPSEYSFDGKKLERR